MIVNLREARRQPVSVAIPVRDEEERLAACLEAVDNQARERANHIVLLLNNCTDRSAKVARGLRARLGSALHVLEIELPRESANADMPACWR